MNEREQPLGGIAENRSAFSEDALRRGQRFQVAFVRAACWLFILGPAATGALHVLKGHAERLPGIVPFSALGLAGLVLLARGRTRTAFIALAYGGWLCTLNIGLWTGGLAAPALSALPVIIALAGWLAGPRASLLLMGATAPYLLLLALAAGSGWAWPALASPYEPFHLALVYGLSTAGAGLLGYFAARSNDAYIANLQESERALREKVGELTARERELASARDSFETLFRSSPDAMTLTRLRDGVVVDVNEAFTRNSGFERDQIVGRRAEDLSLWADPALRSRLVAELLSGSPVLDRAMQARHRDGRPLTMRFSGARVNVAGEPHMLAVTRDVTGEEATREALAQRERDLDAANRSLAFQVSLHELTERIARVGHWTSSRSRDTLRWSDSFFDLCGVQRRGPMPSGEYRKLIRIVDQEAFDAARDRLDGKPAVYRVTLADGSPRWFRASLHRPPGVGEGNDECLGVAQDITGEHEAKLALERLNAELEQRVASRTGELRSANDELDAFAYSVAHDLTAPLRAINGFAALVESDGGARLDDASRSHLGRIRQASSRMASLIEDLLRLSHVTRTNLDRRPLDLSALAREVAAELSQADPGRTVTWHIEEGLVASADRGLARVLLANLLGNAWKYTRHAAHPEIALERAADEGRPDEFRVRDNGVGFDMAYAAQLFAPFRRLHGPQEFEGNGIGLATVHRIVRRHGGEVRARGEPGRGASFCFTLPSPP